MSTEGGGVEATLRTELDPTLRTELDRALDRWRDPSSGDLRAFLSPAELRRARQETEGFLEYAVVMVESAADVGDDRAREEGRVVLADARLFAQAVEYRQRFGVVAEADTALRRLKDVKPADLLALHREERKKMSQVLEVFDATETILREAIEADGQADEDRARFLLSLDNLLAEKLMIQDYVHAELDRPPTASASSTSITVAEAANRLANDRSALFGAATELPTGGSTGMLSKPEVGALVEVLAGGLEVHTHTHTRTHTPFLAFSSLTYPPCRV
ncbi:Hypothetical protein UVM_LOCUS110 [uncultured virus]|nr:Hypothetical protein UVM_LOCUS110 [uncultured virus]